MTAFNYPTNAPLKEALRKYREILIGEGFSPKSERVSVEQAAYRVSAEPIYAKICSPHHPVSTMDGIALAAGLTYNASEDHPVTLHKPQYMPVLTGDPIPDSCNAVVKSEDTAFDSPDTLRVYQSVSPKQNVRQIGEDICAGEMILGSFSEITPAALGALISGGITEVNVLTKPVIGYIPVGDHMIPPVSIPSYDDIPDANSSMFSSTLTDWQTTPRLYPIVPDEKDEIRAALKIALRECNIVLLGSGSSAGRENNTVSVISELGSVLCHGLAIKPGRPTVLGHHSMIPIIGIPANPASGLIVLEEIVRPLINEWYRADHPDKTICEATLTKPIKSDPHCEEFVRVRVGKVADKLIASPLNRGSGVVTSLMKADGLVRIPEEGVGYEAGEAVSVDLLKPVERMSRTLVVTGSHDMLLDELADMLHAKYPDLYMMSSHVGSMGGLMAIKRGEAHIAGTHLFDEKNGTYNTSFIRKRFPKGDVKLIECVYRVQGLMLPKGNPRDIRSIRDLAKSGLRYVNRQKGCGTRILIDYLMKKEKIDTGSIYGYDHEEMTHTAVAAQIAGGTADAGLGVMSAAKLYDLDFVPVCTEQYDLLISDEAYKLDVVQKLLDILKSDEFAARLKRLGGYELRHPGTVRQVFDNQAAKEA